MDIWQWVSETVTDLQESGQERLATIVNRLPQAALAHRYEEADALAYEGLGLARSLGAPWLQVFIRHWHLQARVANRGEGASALAEAVSALEAAHRDETRDCPQAVCTVQDLAICYSRTDGVGWAPERLAVAEEALASINPSWPCFACITSEKATALNDLGRPEEALSALDAARAAMSYDQSEFVTIIARLETMIALRRWDDAVRAAERFRPQQDEGSEQRQLQVLVRRAFALASSGRTTDAASCLPGADQIAPADMRWWPERPSSQQLTGRWTTTGSSARSSRRWSLSWRSSDRGAMQSRWLSFMAAWLCAGGDGTPPAGPPARLNGWRRSCASRPRWPQISQLSPTTPKV